MFGAAWPTMQKRWEQRISQQFHNHEGQGSMETRCILGKYVNLVLYLNASQTPKFLTCIPEERKDLLIFVCLIVHSELPVPNPP